MRNKAYLSGFFFKKLAFGMFPNFIMKRTILDCIYNDKTPVSLAKGR